MDCLAGVITSLDVNSVSSVLRTVLQQFALGFAECRFLQLDALFNYAGKPVLSVLLFVKSRQKRSASCQRRRDSERRGLGAPNAHRSPPGRVIISLRFDNAIDFFLR